MHKFREVVAVSAKRLTDRQKKKIVADYVQLQSYARAAKLNDVAESTVRKIVKDNPKCADLCALKKEQNTQDMLSYLGSKRGEAQDLLGLYLQAMADKESPSSRRAWIEITLLLLRLQQVNVALLAEGVD